MTTIQTLTRRTVAITYVPVTKNPKKIKKILDDLGLTKKGSSKSRLSEDHDKILYRS